jgi:hypothetical protein
MRNRVHTDGGTRHFDPVQALCAVAVFGFLTFAGLDVLRSWPAAERGMLLFERACPIYTSAQQTT